MCSSTDPSDSIVFVDGLKVVPFWGVIIGGRQCLAKERGIVVSSEVLGWSRFERFVSRAIMRSTSYI
jgi:hypothetical protein